MRESPCTQAGSLKASPLGKRKRNSRERNELNDVGRVSEDGRDVGASFVQSSCPLKHLSFSL